MFNQTYRLIRATAAVVKGVTRQVCKVLPENSVIVIEEANDDGKTVNVRCGTEKLWMFALDLMQRCRKLTRPEPELLPPGLKLLTAPGSDENSGLLPRRRDDLSSIPAAGGLPTGFYCLQSQNGIVELGPFPS